RAGVPFAVAALSSSISLNGLAGRDLTSLPLEAAFAIRGGCSEATALAALTIVPARLLGLQDRLGSIEKGKDADLIILDGPPLDYRSYVETAIVSGKVRYDRVKDHVYPVFDRATLK
ncbi:MAG: amidohydrolase family protein, partial [Pirellulaceae bacterium]|nr:amidohydrolase family protein [Pirellulaceae bacterium]